VQDTQVLDQPAKEIALKSVQKHMDAGYGIYAGSEQRWAVLRFNPQAARWASREEWHPAQQGQSLPDGSFELRLPYVDANELAMDVLRQGAEVQVLEPPELVDLVRRRLADAAVLYVGRT